MKLHIQKELLLDQIADDIGDFCCRWGRINVSQTKAKFGTVRVYCVLGISTFHGLIYPQRIYKHPRWPQWLWRFDIWHGDKLLKWFSPLVFRWQNYIYRISYKRAVKKHPNLRKEILLCADHIELLEGL